MTIVIYLFEYEQVFVCHMDTLRLTIVYLAFVNCQTQGIQLLTLRLRYGKRILVRSLRISS